MGLTALIGGPIMLWLLRRPMRPKWKPTEVFAGPRSEEEIAGQNKYTLHAVISTLML